MRVVATTDYRDDPIVSLARRLNVGWYRGSDEDVLGRVLGAARKYKADTIVELHGDNPLMDPAMIDAMIGEFQKRTVDYLANTTIKKLVPHGFDIQIFPTSILSDVSRGTPMSWDLVKD